MFNFIIKAMEFCKERVILAPVTVSPIVQSLKLKPATSRFSDSKSFLIHQKFSHTINDLINAQLPINAPYLIDAPL